MCDVRSPLIDIKFELSESQSEHDLSKFLSNTTCLLVLVDFSPQPAWMLSLLDPQSSSPFG